MNGGFGRTYERERILGLNAFDGLEGEHGLDMVEFLSCQLAKERGE